MLKKYFQEILFSLLVVLFSFSGLFIYLRLITQGEKKDSGFVNATQTESNKYVCEANNFNCVKSLIIDLKITQEFYGNDLPFLLTNLYIPFLLHQNKFR